MDDVSAWNWAWSLPLIVLNVIFHVLGLGFINSKVVQVLTIVKDHRHFLYAFALVMGLTAILVTLLHAIEAGIWAGAFRTLGALPDNKSAMLYSLSAITTYGHAEIFLATHWRLMGALEALNGVILFGLTTAFLYGMIQRVWPLESREWHAPGMPGSRRKHGSEVLESHNRPVVGQFDLAGEHRHEHTDRRRSAGLE
jgi:hypothetical protein